MKKIITVFIIVFAFVSTYAQKEKLNMLFDKYQEAEGVTSIKIAKPMFNMLNKLNIDDAELDNIKPLLSKINGLKILIIEKPEVKDPLSVEGKKMLLGFQNLSSEISSAVKQLNYEELITVNSKDNKIRFLSADTTGEFLDNLLLSVNAEGNNILMMLDGRISMDDVNKLINEADKQTKGKK